MKATNLSSHDFNTSLLCMILYQRQLVRLVLITIMFIFIFSSCESSTTIISQSSIIAVGESICIKMGDKDYVDNDSVVVFCGNDILWFNPSTREIKFVNNMEFGAFHTYQKIHFKLNNNYLFTAQTYASQQHSFIIKDLVLYIDVINRKYYLHDGYPLNIVKDDPDTIMNKQKRSNAWNSFLEQLKIENRIK